MSRRTITSADVARLAKVKPVTVCSWKAEWPDFPKPAATYGRAYVYYEDEMWDWLIAHRKIVVEE